MIPLKQYDSELVRFECKTFSWVWSRSIYKKISIWTCHSAMQNEYIQKSRKSLLDVLNVQLFDTKLWDRNASLTSTAEIRFRVSHGKKTNKKIESLVVKRVAPGPTVWQSQTVTTVARTLSDCHAVTRSGTVDWCLSPPESLGLRDPFWPLRPQPAELRPVKLRPVPNNWCPREGELARLRPGLNLASLAS